MKPGIKTISEMTGFSPATVSNVLNNKKGVNRETAERIRRIAREIGYAGARKIDRIFLVRYIKSGKVLADTPFFADLLAGIEDACHQNGLDLLLRHLDPAAPDFDDRLREVCGERGAGLLLLATELSFSDLAPFIGAGMPLVLLDAWFEDAAVDTVLINNTDSVCAAVTHLIENGHTQIGHLKSSVTIQNFYYRRLGYLRAHDRAGIPVCEAFDAALEPTLGGAYEDMRAYLTGRPALPTAYFADNDIIAFGAMKALLEYGCRIPEDISIIGFDDMPFCEIASPQLSTIRVFKREMGVLAVERLLRRLADGDGICTKTQVLTRLVMRGSVQNIQERK